MRPSAASYDSDNVVRCVSNHWQFTRCHSDHFRPFSMISDVFMEFPMFAHLYLTYRYINGLSMHSPYYSIPIRCVLDILQLCFDFIYCTISTDCSVMRHCDCELNNSGVSSRVTGGCEQLHKQVIKSSITVIF